MNYSRYYERIMKKLYSQVKKVYERIHVTHNNQSTIKKLGTLYLFHRTALSPFHPKLPFPYSVLFCYPLSIISLPLPPKLYPNYPSPHFSICLPLLPLSLQFPLPSYPFLSLNFQDFIHLVILLTVCNTILMTLVLRIRYKIN